MSQSRRRTGHRERCADAEGIDVARGSVGRVWCAVQVVKKGHRCALVAPAPPPEVAPEGAQPDVQG